MRPLRYAVCLGILSAQAHLTSHARLHRNRKRVDEAYLVRDWFDSAYRAATWAITAPPPTSYSVPTGLPQVALTGAAHPFVPYWGPWDGETYERQGEGGKGGHGTFFFHRDNADFCIKMDDNVPLEDRHASCLLTVTPKAGNGTNEFSVAVYDSRCQNLTVPDLYWPLDSGRLHSSPYLGYPLNLTSWLHQWGPGFITNQRTGEKDYYLRYYPNPQVIMGPWMSFVYAGVRYNLGDEKQCTCNYMRPKQDQAPASLLKRGDVSQATVWVATLTIDAPRLVTNKFGDTTTTASRFFPSVTVTNLQGPSLVPLCQCTMPCHWPRPGKANDAIWAPADVRDLDYGAILLPTGQANDALQKWSPPQPDETTPRDMKATPTAPAVPASDEDPDLKAFAGDDFGTHYFDYYKQESCLPLDKLQKPYPMLPGNLAATCFANFRYDSGPRHWRVTLYDSQCQNITQIGIKVDSSARSALRGRWMSYPIWPSVNGADEKAQVAFDMSARGTVTRYMVQPAPSASAQMCYTQWVSRNQQGVATVLPASAAGATAVHQCSFPCHWKPPVQGLYAFLPGGFKSPAATPGTAISPVTWSRTNAPAVISEPSWKAPGAPAVTAAPTNPNEPAFAPP